MWMTLSELNVARMSPSVIVIQDYLYVFGGKTDTGYTNLIERLNLKSLQSKFELIDVKLNEPCCDLGLIPYLLSENQSEIMIIGGYNGHRSLATRYKLTAATSC